MSTGFLIVCCGVFGLLVGSFLNAWAYRLPRHVSVARGRSYCPSCEHPIAWYDNVPLVSYLVLRGCCRACGARISPRYPIGEAVTAALFAGAAAFTGLEWLLLAQLFFLAVLVLVSEIDLEFKLIPNVIVLPAAVIGLAAMIALEPARWYEWLGASLGSAAFLFVVAAIYERIRGVSGLGMGDVKLALCMGAFLGWSVIPALFIGFVLGAVVGIVIMARHKGDMKTAIPFGPFLAVGGVIGLFLGPTIIAAYLDLVLR
jgi:leader peptidase (prepilin peptidase) / N-methyltransferase